MKRENRMENIELNPLGGFKIHTPRACVSYDLISCWSENQSRAHLGRLSAAAIGIALLDAGLPRYDIDAALPISYGGVVMDKLISRGVEPSEIIEKGMLILTKLAPQILREEDIKKK
jgi:uncharacterized protein YjiS (DUF1127 family)